MLYTRHPQPQQSGWEIDEGVLDVTWTEGELLPKKLQGLIVEQSNISQSGHDDDGHVDDDDFVVDDDDDNDMDVSELDSIIY